MTNKKSFLFKFKYLGIPYDIGGVTADEVALTCTGIGYLPWQADNGETLMVRCLFCSEADGTIISPNDVCLQYRSKFKAYNLFAAVSGGYGHVEFLDINLQPALRYTMTMSNNLWYHTIQVPKPPLTTTAAERRNDALIRSMSNRASYELWHNRLGHPSQHVMENIHKYVDGVPRLSHNDLWKCSSCSQDKLRKTPIGTPSRPPQSSIQPKQPKPPPQLPPQPKTLYPG